MWLGWLEHPPVHQSLQVRFPVGAHTPVVGFIPQSGRVQEGSFSMFLSHIDVSLSISASLPSPSLKAMKKKGCPWVRIKIY